MFENVFPKVKVSVHSVNFRLIMLKVHTDKKEKKVKILYMLNEVSFGNQLSLSLSSSLSS